MNQRLEVAQSIAWSAVAASGAYLAVMGFLHDLFPNNSHNWGIAAAIVVGAAGLIIAFPRGSLGRALLTLASLTIASFLISYVVLDALMDPIMRADWPIAIVAMLLALWLARLFAILVFDEPESA